MAEKVRTRIAPSPTGNLHVGTARTALFNYLFARKHGGQFIIRIEDTDKERSKQEYEDDIFDGLAWLGLTPDEVHRQSELVANHTEALQQLIAEDKAYISKEPAKDDPGRFVAVVRLRNPGEKVTFTDLIRGEVTADTSDLGDFVIARAIDDPLFHLAVVVDDAMMGITHVIRGEDHVSNTPRQILIQRALGLATPQYAHLPLLLAPDRSKLSKRKHAVSIADFRKKGYLPAAFLNYLAFLGWNPGTEQEVMSLPEIMQVFDITKIQKGGAIFDETKLAWYNRAYLDMIDDDTYSRYTESVLAEIADSRDIPFIPERARKLVPIVRERISVWSELAAAVEAGEYDFAFVAPNPSKELLLGKENDAAAAAGHLEWLQKALSEAPESAWEAPEALKELIWDYASEKGRGAVLWPLRVALSGREKSPDPFTILSVLGQEESFKRIETARATLLQ